MGSHPPARRQKQPTREARLAGWLAAWGSVGAYKLREAYKTYKPYKASKLCKPFKTCKTYKANKLRKPYKTYKTYEANKFRKPYKNL